MRIFDRLRGSHKHDAAPEPASSLEEMLRHSIEQQRAKPAGKWRTANPNRAAAFDNRRSPAPPYARLLKSGGRIAVVGESFYRDAIATICGDCGEDGVNIGFTALLVPDPDNPKDANCVGVFIEGERVGHLSRFDALEYQPIATRLAHEDAVGACNATIRGGFAMEGRDADFGITLDLAEPREIIADLNRPTSQLASG